MLDQPRRDVGSGELVYAQVKAAASGFMSGLLGKQVASNSDNMMGLSDFVNSEQSANVRNYKRAIGDAKDSSVVMSALNLIVRNWLLSPPIIYRKESDGDRIAIPDHDMLALLANPSMYEQGKPFMHATLLDWLIHGNAYWEKVRNAYGAVIELRYIPHRYMRVDWGWNYDILSKVRRYWVSGGGTEREVPMRDVVHLRYSIDDANNVLGEAPIRSLYREIYIDEQAAQYEADILLNQGVPGMIVFPKNNNVNVDKGSARIMREELRQQYTGRQRGEPLVLTSETGVEQFIINPEQMLLTEHRAMAETRAGAITGIPPSVSSLYSGMQQTKDGTTMLQQRRQAWEDTIIPYQSMVGEQLQYQLLNDFEVDVFNYIVDYDRTEIPELQQNSKERAEEYHIRMLAGITTRGEARRAFNLAIIPEDDKFFAASNMKHYSREGEPEEEPEPAGQKPGQSTPFGNEIANQGGEGEGEPPPLDDKTFMGVPGAPIAEDKTFEGRQDVGPRSHWEELHIEADDQARWQETLIKETGAEFESEVSAILADSGAAVAKQFVEDVDQVGGWDEVAKQAQAQEIQRKALEGDLEKAAPGTRAEKLQDQLRVVLQQDTPEHALIGTLDTKLASILAPRLKLIVDSYNKLYQRMGQAHIGYGNANYSVSGRWLLSARGSARLETRAATRASLLSVTQGAEADLAPLLHQHALRGTPRDQVVDAIKEKIVAGKWRSTEIRARVIARTEERKSANWGVVESFRDKRGFIGFKLRDGIVPENSDATCLARDGKVYSAREAAKLVEGEHPQGTATLTAIVDRGLSAAETENFVGRPPRRVRR